MKFFKWLGNAGRVSAAALLGAGGVAVVGVLGTAAYLLNGPDGNTSFSDLGYSNPDQVVFTSGSNIGYEKGDGSNPFISSRGVGLIDDQAVSIQRQKEMAEQREAAEKYAAYGTSHGDGLVGNPNFDADKIETAGLRDVMTNLNDSIAAVSAGQMGGQPGGQPGASGGEGGSDGAGGAQLARAATNWSKGVNTSGINPHSAGGSQGVQNEWAGSAGGAGGANAVGDILANAQQQAQQRLEGARLGSSREFPKPRSQFGTDKDSFAEKARMQRDRAENRLKFAQKRSAYEAKNKNRMPNTTAFMDGDRITGGMTFVDGKSTFNTGGSQGTQDLSSNFQKRLQGAGAAFDAVQGQLYDRQHDVHTLQKAAWICFGIALAMSIAIPFLKAIPIWGHIAALVALGIGLAAVGVLGYEIIRFLQHGWSYRGWAITATVFAGSSLIGLLSSFFLSKGADTVAEAGKGLGTGVSEGANVGMGGVKSGFTFLKELGIVSTVV